MNTNECQLRLIFFLELLPSERTKQIQRVSSALHGAIDLYLNQR